jgi:hypothetical protein
VPDSDREPQPEDGPDYYADHAAWTVREKARKQAFKEKLRSINFGRVPGGAR